MFGTKCVDLKLRSGQIDCWTLYSNTENICYNSWRLQMVWNIVMASHVINKMFYNTILTQRASCTYQDINRNWLWNLSMCLETPSPPGLSCWWRLCWHIWTYTIVRQIRRVCSNAELIILRCCGSTTCNYKEESYCNQPNIVQYCVVLYNIV